MTVTYHVGDTRDITATIPDGSVSLVATSPPFLALRSYLPADHDSKHAEIGSEPDPATFIDTLLGLTAEWGRVLAPWGSIAIELGDSFSGSGGAGGDYADDGWRGGQAKFGGSASKARESRWSEADAHDTTRSLGWPQAKSLALIPQLYAVALAYGINPLTGKPSPAGRWKVRNVVVWHRPNPAVGALGDKVRPSTSYIVIATRDTKRWFDLTAVRGEPSPNTHARTARGVASRPSTGKSAERDGNFDTLDTLHTTAGAPPLDCWFDEWDGSHDTWTITTQPSRLAHYAMWPARLAERLILSMCPEWVCGTCGEPRRRVEKATHDLDEQRRRREHGYAAGKGVNGSRADGGAGAFLTTTTTTLGWTDCGHDNYHPGHVLDPFAGTGTTLAVADLHHRDATGIDLDPRNHDLYPARRAEVARNLFGTTPELPGQLSLMGEL